MTSPEPVSEAQAEAERITEALECAREQRDDILELVDQLKTELAAWEDWSNDLANLLPEDAETWPGANPEGAQESIIEACLAYLVKLREDVRRAVLTDCDEVAE